MPFGEKLIIVVSKPGNYLSLMMEELKLNLFIEKEIRRNSLRRVGMRKTFKYKLFNNRVFTKLKESSSKGIESISA